MTSGARTPEELETLLEDALVVQDRVALTGLFEDGAVLAAFGAEAKGSEEIARMVAGRELSYLAGPRRVLRSRDTALVVAESGINVARRRDDGSWRYVVALLNTQPRPKGAGR
jgi:hypothetical protein